VTKKVPRAVKDALRESVKGSRALPHMSELIEQFLLLSGGPKKVAKMLVEEWHASDPGSVVRSRLLDLLTRIWRYGSDTTSRADDLGQLDDADLDKEVRRLFKEMAPDGEGEEAAPDAG
jgi:hypothetical protein